MKKEKRSFYALFFTLALMLVLALSRLSYRLRDTLDDNLTVAAITAIVVVVFILFFFGVFLSWWLVHLARKNSSLLKRLTKTNAWLFSFLSNDSRDNLKKTVLERAETESIPADEEILEAIQKPKRRGRSSNHPYETRRRTVLAWENRGPNFSYTLAQFLDERFGSSATGMPNVPDDTFYYWRRKILEEIGKDKPKGSRKK
jgi:hypothetical protein